MKEVEVEILWLLSGGVCNKGRNERTRRACNAGGSKSDDGIECPGRTAPDCVDGNSCPPGGFFQTIDEGEFIMILGRGGWSSRVDTCMEMDFSGRLSPEGRRNGPYGVLGNYSRNVTEEMIKSTVNIWRNIKRKWPRGRKEYFRLILLNLLVLCVLFLTGVVTYESSVDVLRHSLETTIIFPIYLPHAIALSLVGRLRWRGLIGVFFGLYGCRMYAAVRGLYLISVTRAMVLLAVAFLGTLEVYAANHFLQKYLMKEGCGKKVPTIEFIKEALRYLATVVICTLIFDTVITLVICTSPLVLWSNFYRFWATSWLGVLAGMLTISPTATHLFAWRPRPSLLRPKKLFETVALTLLTGTLTVIIFVTNLQAVILPLPYFLFPIIILSAFRFNRLGCSMVVSGVSYVCAWASVRGKGSLYRMAGSPVPISSPKLILQVELFVSVLGLVGILLAAAVREKKQLARDLHKMNEQLESTVSERTIELVKANEALKESQRKAELASQAKSDFLANMSHEIRTPIHGIMGLTSLVLDSELSADQRESLLSVQDCANVLLHIINSILDLAKIESGRIEVELVTFRVSQLVSSTVRMLHTRATAKNLDLVWDIDPAVPDWLVGDSGKLQQCLLNLIGNAVKFTHEGSVRIHVRIEKSDGNEKDPSNREAADAEGRFTPSDGLISKPDSAISVFECPVEWQSSTGENGSNKGLKLPGVGLRRDVLYCCPVVFEVHDTGIGVSPEKLQDIFTPFTQADASTSRLYGGTGLGLCIVQRFVELLGGKLTAQSEVGKGSCFSFCVPMGYSPKNHDKVCETRDAVNSIGVLSSEIPTEISSGNDSCSGNQPRTEPSSTSAPPPPPPPAKAIPCRNNDDTCPSNDTEHCRSLSEPRVLEGQRTRDLSSCKYSPEALKHSQSAREAWKPNRSIENLDVLRGNWKQSDPNPKKCSCAGSGSSFSTRGKQSHSSSNLASSNPNQLDASRGKAGKASSFSPSKPPLSVSPLAECTVSIPPTSGFPTVDLDSQSSLVQDTPCIVLESSQSQSLQPTRTPTSVVPQKTDGPSEKDVPQEKNQPLRLRVLLAEDNLVNQKVASRQLQKHKHVVTVVGDGLQALETVRANHDSFDLVLMDVQMPNMDGLEATRQIREYESREGGRRLPILGLTAHAIQGYEETCLKSGMDGYLGKPFDVNQLLRVIDQYIPAKATSS
ncbi:hypothetical protein R1sor_026445 [Riccia sorocarpa]|uniref:histidine kinase n=1 Tax=Riccia sorocarpa TaxID=122646 RepID=A0ABD3GD43_9MARC